MFDFVSSSLDCGSIHDRNGQAMKKLNSTPTAFLTNKLAVQPQLFPTLRATGVFLSKEDF